MQKPPRPRHRTVLVVDVPVNMALVRIGDQRRRVFLIPVVPPVKIQNPRHIPQRPLVRRPQIANHKAPLKQPQRLGMYRRRRPRMRQQNHLRLNPPHPRRPVQRFHRRVQQQVLHCRRRKLPHHIQIANQPLVLIGHRVRVPNHPVPVHQRPSVQRLHIGEPFHQRRRRGEVPRQCLPPNPHFLVQYFVQ